MTRDAIVVPTGVQVFRPGLRARNALPKQPVHNELWRFYPRPQPLLKQRARRRSDSTRCSLSNHLAARTALPRTPLPGGDMGSTMQVVLFRRRRSHDQWPGRTAADDGVMGTKPRPHVAVVVHIDVVVAFGQPAPLEKLDMAVFKEHVLAA